MNSGFSLKDGSSANIQRGRKKDNGLKMRGFFTIEVIREGKVIHKERVRNAIVNVGLDYALSVALDGGSQIGNWYIGLVDNAGWSGFNASDTMASHGTWSELQSYDETTRPEWAPDAPSGQTISNSVAVTFTINATETIKGVFITSNSTKGGTTGTLWATAGFTSTIPVASTDVLKVTYAVVAT